MIDAGQLGRLEEYMQNHFAAVAGCHDFDHTMRVVRLCTSLAQKIPNVDINMLRAAALLHDVARSEEFESRGKICHAKRGAAISIEILEALGVASECATAIAEAVRTHRFRDNEVPTTLEAQILFDADKLDSLGAVGLGRAFLFAGHAEARLHNTSEEALSSEAYSKDDTAYREYLVKLSKLPKLMRTVPGKREARKRVRFMRSFFRRLDRECHLDGLFIKVENSQKILEH